MKNLIVLISATLSFSFAQDELEKKKLNFIFEPDSLFLNIGEAGTVAIKLVDENGDLLIQIIEKDYWLTSKWSAYNFMYLQGPNPWRIFFSLKKLKLENFYDQQTIQKVKQKVVS